MGNSVEKYYTGFIFSITKCLEAFATYVSAIITSNNETKKYEISNSLCYLLINMPISWLLKCPIFSCVNLLFSRKHSCASDNKKRM